MPRRSRRDSSVSPLVARLSSSCISARMRRTRAPMRAPSLVSVTPEDARWNSGPPKNSSIWAICAERAGWLILRRLAACPKCRVSLSVLK